MGNLRLARPALAVACAKKGRDCEFRPEAPWEIPSVCEADGKARRRLPALHPRRQASAACGGNNGVVVGHRSPLELCAAS